MEKEASGGLRVIIYGNDRSETRVYASEEGDLRRVEQLRRGQRDGVYLSFYGTFRPWNFIRFEGGLESGPTIGFYPSGGIERIGYMKQGQPTGLHERRLSGSTGDRSEYGWYEEGRKVGLWRYLARDGTWGVVNER